MATFLEKLRLSELSLVDKGANQHAAVTIFKRAPEKSKTVVDVAKYYYDAYAENKQTAKTFDEILGNIEDQKRLREARDELYPLFEALQSSLSSIAYDANLSADKRLSKIETSVNVFLSAVREKMPEVEAELAKALTDYSAGSSGSNPANHKDNPMADAKTVEELQKSLETLQKAHDDAVIVAKMSDAAKAYMKSLDDDKKAAFMSLSPEAQEAKANAVKKSDETLELHGQTISKAAVGDGMFAIMKAQAVEITKMQEAVAKAQAEAEIQVLAKRADDEFASLPGERLAKARVLKSLDSLSAEDKAVAEQMLKAGASSLAKAFTTIGKGAGEVVEGSAQDKLDKAAKDIAKRDSVSIEKAYATAAQENPELYETADAERVAS